MTWSIRKGQTKRMVTAAGSDYFEHHSETYEDMHVCQTTLTILWEKSKVVPEILVCDIHGIFFFLHVSAKGTSHYINNSGLNDDKTIHYSNWWKHDKCLNVLVLNKRNVKRKCRWLEGWIWAWSWPVGVCTWWCSGHLPRCSRWVCRYIYSTLLPGQPGSAHSHSGQSQTEEKKTLLLKQ